MKNKLNLLLLILVAIFTISPIKATKPSRRNISFKNMNQNKIVAITLHYLKANKQQVIYIFPRECAQTKLHKHLLSTSYHIIDGKNTRPATNVKLEKNKKLIKVSFN